jgi:hypothetical protein
LAIPDASEPCCRFHQETTNLANLCNIRDRIQINQVHNFSENYETCTVKQAIESSVLSKSR